jgi:putative ABC transport system permease protein
MRMPRFWRRQRRDNELTRELESYLAHEIDSRIADGQSPDAARAAAIRKLGNVTRVRETVYEMHSLRTVEQLVRDLRFGARVLRRSLGFAAAAILSIALGIGANTAIFDLLNAVRLRSLPVSRPGELAEIVVDGGNRGMGLSQSSRANLTNPLWEAVRAEQQAFTGVFAWGHWDYVRAGRGNARQVVRLMWASGDLFPTLGLRPALGRLLGPADDRRGCGPGPAIISHAYWLRAFGGRPSVVGTPMVLDDRTFEIAGVTPPEFFGLEVGKRFDVALPLCAVTQWDKDALDQKNAWWLIGMGRLRRGWTLERTSRHLAQLSPGLFAATAPSGYDPSTLRRWRALTLKAVPAGHGVSDWRDQYATSLWLLLGITGLVLLIACANLANLMLARARVREREFALRVAIGASRGRLVTQALAESAIVAAAGGALGGAVAGVLSRQIVSFVSTEGNPLYLELGSDWRVLAFTAAVAILTCLGCGLIPALRSSHADPACALKAGGRAITVGGERFSLQHLLVVTQVAVSLVLVVGALLFVRSFLNLTLLDVGFRQEGLFVGIAGFGKPGVNLTPADSQRIRMRLLDRVRAIPQVQDAATSTIIPLSGMSWTHGVVIPSSSGERRGDSKFTWVSGGYFKTLGLPLLAGRLVNDHDSASSPRVIVVNETFVRKFLDPSRPVGAMVRTIAEPEYPATDFEVVGVVRDTKYGSLRDPVPPMAFAPAGQHPAPQPWTTLLMRSSASVATLTPELTAAYRDAGVPSDSVVWSLRTQVLDTLVRERLVSWISGFFGLVAGLLAAVGVYGVIAYAVACRVSEIAIRVALGAERRDVLWLVLGQALRLVAVGLVVGTSLALAAGRAARSLLFQLEPTDVPTLATAALSLAAIGLLAAYVPARRAARVSPLEGLRAE